ncbi:hypothetical protein BFG52_02215 [Acinetobacter larvae]|uniref:FecR protein domain-containing protein n=1 Tax=Acinetobacter larvae TaxID=1789224 RepID=A0A1B2M3Q3_9GAMM|nr:hypothetical protein BFG52_02215 [Acinetobacter larvae]
MHQNPEDQDQLLNEAADWLLRLSHDDLDIEQLQQLQQWKMQSPQHQQAFDKMAQFIQGLDVLKQQQIKSQHPLIRKHIVKKKSLSKTAAKSLLLFIVAAGLIYQLPIQRWRADQLNAAKQWQQQILSDHSQILLAGKTAYNIDYSNQKRKIQLLEGDIWVDVAKDHQRPFIVSVGDVQIEALGTQFVIRRDAQQLEVNMLESKTKIYSASQQFKSFQLNTGQRARIHDGQVSVQNIDQKQVAQAWQQKKLVVNDMPLDQVLTMLEKYQNSKYLYNRQRLSQYKVTAVLPLDQTDTALALLQEQLSLQIYPVGSLLTWIKAKNNN